MAILRGFPPSNTISPSVRIKETDLSFYDTGNSFHRAGLVGFASKGPIGIPTRISTQKELNDVFGFPHPEMGDPYLLYAAQQYLNIANELWVVRVADQSPTSWEQATTASVEIPSAGGQVIITSDTPETYSFAVDSYFRWRLNDVLASKVLTVLADDNRPAPLTGDPYSCLQLVEDLNLQLTEDDGITFFCTADDEIGVRSTFAYGPDATLELVSVKNSIYGGAIVADGGTNVTGLGTGMTRAIVTGVTDTYPTDGSVPGPGFWDLTGIGVGDSFDLQIVLDGTDSVLIDNVVQTVDLSSLAGTTPSTADVVNAINAYITANLPGGWQAIGGGVDAVDDLKASVPVTLTDALLAAAVAADTITLISNNFGADAKLFVKPASTADAYLGLPNITGEGASPEKVSGDADVSEGGIVSGDANLVGDTTFTITADSAGIDGNNTLVKVVNDTRQGTFTLDIYNNGTQVETWGNLTKDETSRFYVETFIASVSDWIRVVDETSNPATPLGTVGDAGYELVGGSDGIPSDPDDQDRLLVGSLTDMSGAYALSEPEQIDIDLLAIPGHSSTYVMERLIDVCQNQRMDCLAIVDPPFGLYLEEVVQWHNGVHPLNDTKLDSDFAALYWPWLKMRDGYNGVAVWVPPSGSILATYARSDSLSAPWYAPAGIQRGIVSNIEDVFFRPTLAERDLLLGYRNAVNPIIQFVDVDGFVVWGQKTLQRRPTALDRVNVRRMLFVAEKKIRKESRRLLFEPHDDIFHQQFISMATKILGEIKVGRGLNEYKIQADWTLNTPERVDRNEFWAKIGIQPTKAVEFMFLEFSIHRTGTWDGSFE